MTCSESQTLTSVLLLNENLNVTLILVTFVLFRFSPELHMVRPATEGNYWRLDEILKRKAVSDVRGVQCALKWSAMHWRAVHWSEVECNALKCSALKVKCEYNMVHCECQVEWSVNITWYVNMIIYKTFPPTYCDFDSGHINSGNN